MTDLAEVRLWGRTIGAATLADGNDVVACQYDPAFARSGIEISPRGQPSTACRASWPTRCRTASARR